MARRSRSAVQLPKAMSHVNKARVPAVWVQTATAALFTLIAFVIVPSVVGGKSAVDSRTKIYDVIQAAVTVSWCISIVVLFVDILIILRRYRAQSRRAGSPTSGVLSVLHHRRARLAGGDHRHAAGLVDSADQQQSRVGQHPGGSDLLRHLVLVGGRHHVGLLASRCCCTAEAYIDHRRELGVAEVTRRLLRASGIAHLLIETGYLREGILGLAATAEAAGASVAEVVRLAGVAEQAIVAGDGSAAGESLELAPFGKVLSRPTPGPAGAPLPGRAAMAPGHRSNTG